MDVRIISRHRDLPEALKKHAHDRAHRLERFYDRITLVEVVLKTEGEQHAVEMIISAPRGVRLVSSGSDHNMVTALDNVADKMERQLRRHKGKLREHRSAARARRRGEL